MQRALRIDRIFSQALDLPEEEREAWVRSECGDDREMARQVLSLLRLSTVPENAIERPINAVRDRLWLDVLANEPESPEDLSGQTAGPWLIVRCLARGGLATVYLARRNDGAYRQDVAFKVLRRGLDTDDLIARFRAEREILSSLDHPGIARLLDGGALPDGRPYLVLEFVQGLPITEHCNKENLSEQARIELIADVARAISHAHRRMVIHRDIKPSNILVTREQRVRVLDFGIAKLVDPMASSTSTPVTRTGLSMLTPAYASPEQRTGKPLTAASDVYQLGVVLLEVLTGQRPTPPEAEAIPQPLSLPGHSSRDLAAIVGKATHPDLERRYATSNEFVADLERYLQGLPVSAQPDTVGYRLKKLNQRKPWLIPMIAVLAALLIAYVTTLSVYSARLAKARDLAQASQAFLLDLFKSPDPLAPIDAARGSTITVVEGLDVGVRRAHSELADRPEILASLLGAISDVYASLDQSETALSLREEALDLERTTYGRQSPQAVASMRSLGSLYSAVGDHEKADSLLQSQLDIARRIFAPDSPELGLSEIAVGMNVADEGKFAESQALLKSGIAKLRTDESAYPRQLIAALIMSVGQWGMEDREQALATVADAARIADSEFGRNSLQATLVQARLAATLTQFGEYEASKQRFLKSIPVLEAQLGPDHSLTLATVNNLGYLYNRSGDYAAAEQIYRELLQRHLEKSGEKSRSVADTFQNLASAITKQGRYDESIPLHRKAYELFRSLYDDDNFVIAFPLLSIAFAELQRGNAPAAESSAREARDRFERALPGTFFVGVAQCLTGLSLEAQGDTERGAAMVASSHELMQKGSIPEPYPRLCRLNGN